MEYGIWKCNGMRWDELKQCKVGYSEERVKENGKRIKDYSSLRRENGFSPAHLSSWLVGWLASWLK